MEMLLIVLIVILIGSVFYFARKNNSGNSQDQSLNLLQQQMESFRVQFAENMARNNESMARSLNDLSQNMQTQILAMQQNFQNTSGQIHQRLDHASNATQSMTKQLGELSKATEHFSKMSQSITSLQDILKPPKLRGVLGETLLENILAEVFSAQSKTYQLQYAFNNGSIVDALVCLQGGNIPIDAKFPLDNLRRAMETQDEKERISLQKEFARDVKKHAEDIAKKYILQDEGTLPFALMYVPAESVYYEIIQQGDLYDFCMQKKVFPVSPSTFYPYLKTLSLGLRGLKIEEQAQTILAGLSALENEVVRFREDFEVMGSHLTNAQKKFSDSQKRVDKVEAKLTSLKEGR